jgi:hypothetical protein
LTLQVWKSQREREREKERESCFTGRSESSHGYSSLLHAHPEVREFVKPRVSMREMVSTQYKNHHHHLIRVDYIIVSFFKNSFYSGISYNIGSAGHGKKWV